MYIKAQEFEFSGPGKTTIKRQKKSCNTGCSGKCDILFFINISLNIWKYKLYVTQWKTLVSLLLFHKVKDISIYQYFLLHLHKLHELLLTLKYIIFIFIVV